MKPESYKSRLKKADSDIRVQRLLLRAAKDERVRAGDMPELIKEANQRVHQLEWEKV